MRFPLLLTGLLGLSLFCPVQAQSVADSLQRQVPFRVFDAERTNLDRRGLAVLGTWAVGNLVVSGIATGSTEGSAHYFHQMNIGWGAVNLALVGAGYLGIRRAAHHPVTDRAGNVRTQIRTESIYLLNAGLDAAYLATGLYLLEKGRNPTVAGSPERWRGYGHSLLLQGGFLLLFDGFQYATHHRHGRNLYPLLSRVSIGPGTVAITLPLGNIRSQHNLIY